MYFSAASRPEKQPDKGPAARWLCSYALGAAGVIPMQLARRILFVLASVALGYALP